MVGGCRRVGEVVLLAAVGRDRVKVVVPGRGGSSCGGFGCDGEI